MSRFSRLRWWRSSSFCDVVFGLELYGASVGQLQLRWIFVSGLPFRGVVQAGSHPLKDNRWLCGGVVLWVPSRVSEGDELLVAFSWWPEVA